MSFVFRPITTWPRPFTKERRTGDFVVTYDKTLRLLMSELRCLRADFPVVIEAAVSEADLRLDGMLRATATLQHPGIIVSFTGSVGGKPTPMRFVCDHFRHWQSNLRAIGLTLERLRLVDSFGVTRSGEQYAGWKQLPDRSTSDMSATSAAAMLAAHGGHAQPIILASSTAFTEAHRASMRYFHPDNAETGNADLFQAINNAAAILKRHHGI
jgi:hypothetical protein